MTDDAEEEKPAVGHKTPEEARAYWEKRLSSGEPIMTLFGDHTTTVALSESAQLILDLPAMGFAGHDQAAVVRVVLEPVLLGQLRHALEWMQKTLDERGLEAGPPTQQ